ncbi:3-isopropylmalate dehydratase small subunit [Suttonella ornithocola]|uniref:3-isopropylmalate dehydratase small subunit n=1 Tax=Suttonella ornithocola TaxID=279832 RepID=A0A380MM36_9GAMM|nr:3-isopropylmalate dehydratase small subunit [Suttonella ornithocola]SUO93318.1 3-isopropylmalate dehydratase small subunit [Suttonella ornithocola]
MKPLTVYTATTVPIMADNIDTDIIIPKNYLKSIFKTGFGEFAFDPWRYQEDRTSKPDFPLNQTQYQGAGILITGENFGCGSSREHAAWALQDVGLRVIIAGGYSDIFHNNWLNNGNLPIVMPKDVREKLAALPADKAITVDLAQKKVIVDEQEYPFEIGENWRQRLLNGLDSIGITLQHEDAIKAYEKAHG